MFLDSSTTVPDKVTPRVPLKNPAENAPVAEKVIVKVSPLLPDDGVTVQLVVLVDQVPAKASVTVPVNS
jgi:hypothetical protein